MAADFLASIQSAASAADQLDQYRRILLSIVASNNVSQAKAFVDHNLSGEVPPEISCHLLSSIAEEIPRMEPEAHREVADYAFRRIVSKQDKFHVPKCGSESQSTDVLSDHQTSRSHHTVTAVGSKLVLFGGIRNKVCLNDVHIFNTVTGKWVQPEILGTPPAPRYGHSAVLLNGEKILIYGGNSSIHNDTVWFLEVETPFIEQQRKLLGREVVAWSKGILGNLPKPVVICGPSGVGKGTLIGRLMKEFPSTFGFSVSHTTRKPREKEQNGVHYHFIERHAMELAIQEGKFLEFADVHGNLYGTSIAAVEAVTNSGKRCILDIDVQGAQSVKKSGLDALFIFIAPPSLEQLEKRLRGRGTETEEQVQKRLRNARVELHQGSNSLLFNHYMVNDELEECYSALKKILGLDGFDSHASSNGVGEKDPDPRHGHATSIVGENIYIIGGYSGSNLVNSITTIDISNISGGAPGLTAGLRFSSSIPKCNGHIICKHNAVGCGGNGHYNIEGNGNGGNGHLQTVGNCHSSIERNGHPVFEYKI